MKNTNNTRRDVCRIANELSHKHGFTRAEAMAKAWRTVKLRNRLRTSAEPVSFTYRKADGSERLAIGTLNAGLFQYEPKGSSAKYNPVYVRYYDLTRNAFRQFSALNLVA